nr:hypothetical protein [uncultured Draconibacterium sp.]
MLRFFSKMRYKLAAENRVAKYMRYAVEEILLVVIGILVALQVKNWNESRKMQKLKPQLSHKYQERIIDRYGYCTCYIVNTYTINIERLKNGRALLSR